MAYFDPFGVIILLDVAIFTPIKPSDPSGKIEPKQRVTHEVADMICPKVEFLDRKNNFRDGPLNLCWHTQVK